jgi:hypothetical protein
LLTTNGGCRSAFSRRDLRVSKKYSDADGIPKTPTVK